MIKRSRIRPVSPKRAKRPGVAGKAGIVRLYGKDLLALKHECHERDRYRCKECRRAVFCRCGEFGSTYHGIVDGISMYCFADAVGLPAEMAHIHARRNGGDTLDNVRTLCAECHRKEHTGELHGKPCPRKESA